jgi:hypothetical protein
MMLILGRLLVTQGVLESVSRAELMDALARHSRGDWGLVDADDQRANDEALKNGSRLLSAYQTADGTAFWVITEADRASTTVLLPEEY